MCITKYSIKPIKPKNRRHQVYYLEMKWKVEVMKEINESALVLLEYYYSKSGAKNFDYNSDESVAKALGWKTTKVRDNRLRLQSHDFYKQTRYSSSDGDVIYEIKLGHDRWLPKTKANTEVDETKTLKFKHGGHDAV